MSLDLDIKKEKIAVKKEEPKKPFRLFSGQFIEEVRYVQETFASEFLKMPIGFEVGKISSVYGMDGTNDQTGYADSDHTSRYDNNGNS